jgi:hypothetical protein
MKTFASAVSLLLCSAALTIHAQPVAATVDFEGLAEGAIVSELTLGAGYSSTVNLGSIQVFGTNPAYPTENAAMIFDSNCSGAGCSGDDPDLGSNNGNVLIITEDFDSDDPDDNALGGTLEFDFSTLFAGEADIVSLQITDTEAGGTIQLFAGLVLLTTIDLPESPEIEDGDTAVVPINVSGVTLMRVNLVESGSVDAIEFTAERGEFGGCSPGFWSQRGLRASYWTATGYAPADDYDDVFGNGPEISLYSALTARGNASGQALLRHSVAALLNAAHPDINFPFSEAEVIALTHAAWDDGRRNVINALKDTFDDANNLGCFD